MQKRDCSVKKENPLKRVDGGNMKKLPEWFKVVFEEGSWRFNSLDFNGKVEFVRFFDSEESANEYAEQFKVEDTAAQEIGG